MALERQSPCKVNLLLNILGKRPDGFHELETVMHPVRFFDEMRFERGGRHIRIACNLPTLPVDAQNLVYRAARAFRRAANVADGVRIRLIKRIPLAAGRGEQIRTLGFFPALRGKAFLLIHPGFGIATAWAYQRLAGFPSALNGRPGRAAELVAALQAQNWPAVAGGFYNSLEAPALDKFPILALFQEFLRTNGALATLMSGSGSTTFAIVENVAAGGTLVEKFKERFGRNCWTAVVGI